MQPFAEFPDEHVATVIGTQLLGTLNVSRPAWRAMAASGGGRFVNVSSGAAYGGFDKSTVYSMAKAGVIGLTIAMANEGEPVGITANVVAPYAKTRPGTGFGPIPWSEGLAEWLHPRQVAPVVTWLAHDTCDVQRRVLRRRRRARRPGGVRGERRLHRPRDDAGVGGGQRRAAGGAGRPTRRWARLAADAQHDGRLHRLTARSVRTLGGLGDRSRASGGGEDVDHEHQGVGAADAGLGVAGRAVALVGRDHEQHPGADGLADEALVEAGDELAGADDEVGRRAALPRAVEHRAAAPRSCRRTAR